MFSVKSRILVVDDSVAMRTRVSDFLGDMGYRDISEAENGSVALELAKDEQKNGSGFTLIILDWNMPVMNGINFLVEVKADPELKHIPVLIVTSESGVKQVAQAVAAGASEYVVKPFDEVVFKEKIMAVWKRSGGKS